MSCGDNFHKFYLLTLIDYINELLTLGFGLMVVGLGVVDGRSNLFTSLTTKILMNLTWLA